jgi:hypothetical protein
MVGLAALGATLVLGNVAPASAQTADNPSATATDSTAADVGKFLGGAAVGLLTHEAGHLLFDVAFDARPGVGRVDFHGIPFFAITHRSDLSPKREYLVSSAGFHVQHLENEILLRKDLRHADAPFGKGMLAFNVITSAAYAGAAFAKTGPYERDTRGMADSVRVNERIMGVLILAPALLDTWRYLHPDAKRAAWTSRGFKVGLVLMVFR